MSLSALALHQAFRSHKFMTEKQRSSRFARAVAKMTTDLQPFAYATYLCVHIYDSP
jgi:hypothetical protein